MFRLPQHEAIINRLGFNNDGVDALLRNVQRASWRGVLGINIGKNAVTPNERAIDDYIHCLERVYPLASYVTVNISSPNTKGLRDLQGADELPRLLGRLRERHEQLALQHRARKPLLLKIAPDLDGSQMDAIATAVLDAGVDGLICTNTTIDRSAIAGEPLANEAGGLSGKPLFEKSTAILHGMAQRIAGRIPLIGVGGILSGDDAAGKLDAGATLVQIYTGMVYRGPWLLTECVEEIRRRLDADGNF
jgi:dihydroorotate dehydrogenase